MITLMFGAQARKEILAGEALVYKPVAASMGPSGRNTLIEHHDQLYVTKDGASIARYISSAIQLDRFENAGALLIRKASQKAEEDAGDGTTKATIFAYELFSGALEHLEKGGANVIKIKKGMELALEKVIESIEKQKREANTKEAWYNVAKVSSQDDEIAEMISTAMSEVGMDGHIRVEKGDDWEEHEMELDIKKGMHFWRGYITDQCINDLEKQVCKLRDVPILVTDMKLMTKRHYDHVQAICDAVIQSFGIKEMVICALQFEQIVKDYISWNNTLYNQSGGAKGMRILAFEVPGYGSDYTDEFAGDIATLVGAKVISDRGGKGIDEVSMNMLGKAEIVECSRKETRIINSDSDKDAVERRIAEIDARYESSNSELEKKRMKERKASLTTGMAVITVGGHLDTAISEKKDRVDDAVLAVKCAAEEGIVPGGGIVELQAKKELEKFHSEDPDIEIGIRLVENSLASPIRQIAVNCGLDPDEIELASDKLGATEGFDFSKGKVVVDMFEAGIVDPVKVCKCSIRHGVENAGVALTLETVGVTLPVDKENRPIWELIRGDAAERIKKSDSFQRSKIRDGE